MSSSDPDPSVFCVADDQAGQRLDAFLAAHLIRYTRVQIRRAIQAKQVTVDGRQTKVAYRLRAGQQVEVIPPEPSALGPEPENIPLDVVFEDDHLIAINKKAGMVVHPAKGHWSGTLASALAYHFDQLSTLGGPTRPGIVHRLDRETSGVIVVAKTDEAHVALAQQFESRSIEKVYSAIVRGVPDRDRDVIDRPIGMHPQQREKMAIRQGHTTSRPAQTAYEVAERFDRWAFLEVRPRTGRTHQIRVHLAHIGCPILCDRLYAGHARITRGEIRGPGADQDLLLDRLALHASYLRIRHPVTEAPLDLSAPIPEDIASVLAELRTARDRHP
jgi:23S rRNA pseudouridine1911/1915/1917 synthase